ncbi:MAG: septum formation protein Maf [Isosphaera sp.]|nr:septum formation protein Maf [Isosphaera sp.]
MDRSVAGRQRPAALRSTPVSPTAGTASQESRAAAWPEVLLASASPRRTQLLRGAGVRHRVIVQPIDDAALSPGCGDAERWPVALAYLKSRAAMENELCRAPGQSADRPVVVIGADTVLIHRGKLLGKPADAAEARRVLAALRSDEHVAVTGVALSCAHAARREFFAVRATVRFGAITEGQLDEHVGSGAWAGKAGGYNLGEVVAAGWDVTCQGDPTAVIGLPMEALTQRLRAWGVPLELLHANNPA